MSDEEMKKKAMGKMTDEEKKAYENMSEADKEKTMAKAKEMIKN